MLRTASSARAAVLCGSGAAGTSSVIPYTRRFSPRSSAIEQVPPSVGPSALSQNANGVDMSMTPKNTGWRLLRTREALELSQAEFCRQIGVERNLYNPFEKGRRRITIENSRSLRYNARLDLCWRPTCFAVRPVSQTRRFGRLRILSVRVSPTYALIRSANKAPVAPAAVSV